MVVALMAAWEGQLAYPALALFAIDSLSQSGYTPAAPQGVNGKRSLKKKPLALSH